MGFRKLVIATIATLLMGGVFSASAQTDGDGGEATVTADLTITGTRSVTSVSPLTLDGALSALPTDAYTVVVDEALRTGTNPWSVTGRVCGPDADNLLVSDCTNRGDQLVHATEAGETIAGANLSVDNRAVSELVAGGSGTLTTPAGSEDFSAARTLFTNSNQSTTETYTETYTATGDVDLAPPDGTATGTYNGYFVVTLIQ